MSIPAFFKVSAERIDPSVIQDTFCKVLSRVNLDVAQQQMDLLFEGLVSFSKKGTHLLFAPFPLLRNVKTAENHAKALTRILTKNIISLGAAQAVIAKFYGFKQWKIFLKNVSEFEMSEKAQSVRFIEECARPVTDVSFLEFRGPGGVMSNCDEWSTDLREPMPPRFASLFNRTYPVAFAGTEASDINHCLVNFHINATEVFEFIGDSREAGLALFAAFCLNKKIAIPSQLKQDFVLRLSPLEVYALPIVYAFLEYYFFGEIEGFDYFDNMISKLPPLPEGAANLLDEFVSYYTTTHAPQIKSKSTPCPYPEKHDRCYGDATPDEMLLWCLSGRPRILKYVGDLFWDYWVDPNGERDGLGYCPFKRKSNDVCMCTIGGIAPGAADAFVDEMLKREPKADTPPVEVILGQTLSTAVLLARFPEIRSVAVTFTEAAEAVRIAAFFGVELVPVDYVQMVERGDSYAVVRVLDNTSQRKMKRPFPREAWLLGGRIYGIYEKGDVAWVKNFIEGIPVGIIFREMGFLYIHRLTGGAENNHLDRYIEDLSFNFAPNDQSVVEDALLCNAWFIALAFAVLYGKEESAWLLSALLNDINIIAYGEGITANDRYIVISFAEFARLHSKNLKSVVGNESQPLIVARAANKYFQQHFVLAHAKRWLPSAKNQTACIAP